MALLFRDCSQNSTWKVVNIIVLSGDYRPTPQGTSSRPVMLTAVTRGCTKALLLFSLTRNCVVVLLSCVVVLLSPYRFFQVVLMVFVIAVFCSCRFQLKPYLLHFVAAYQDIIFWRGIFIQYHMGDCLTRGFSEFLLIKTCCRNKGREVVKR